MTKFDLSGLSWSSEARRISELLASVGLQAPKIGENNTVAFAKVIAGLEKLVAVAKAAERHPIVCTLLAIDDERFDDYQDKDQALIDALSALDIQHDEDDEFEEAQ